MTSSGGEFPRIELDGEPASAGQLRVAALDSYGHFTAMQVRGRRVRGLAQHLARLDGANRELFGVPIDAGQVRSHIRHALGDDLADASVRVYLREPGDGPTVMVTARPPGGMPGSSAWRLKAVPYQRAVAHIKRPADFGQRYYQRLAHAAGFDEALLTGPDGLISEGSITNIGFFDGDCVRWPAAPSLAGITMQVIEPALASHGWPARRAHVRLADLSTFAAVFVTCARGMAAVLQVDDQVLPQRPDLMRTLAKAYESVGWDEI